MKKSILILALAASVFSACDLNTEPVGYLPTE